MYLVAYLAGLDAGYSVTHATLLGYATSLVALFGFNIYQHTIARHSNNLEIALDACAFQYRLLLIAGSGLWAATLAGWISGWNLPLGLMAVLASLGLAQTEVTFSMVTAHGKTWRPLLFYGSQSIFIVCYLLMVSQKMAVVPTVLISVAPLFLINYLAYRQLRTHGSSNVPKDRTSRLEEYRERAVALLAQAPVVATVPALIYLMGSYSGRADQIPQLLLFVSYAGAVVFILSNSYHFYGHSLMPRLLALLRTGQWHLLLMLTVGVIITSLLLTVPVGVLLGWMKEGKIVSWPMEWYLSVGVFAAGTALTQWYSAICVGLKKPLLITITNTIYLFVAVLIVGLNYSIFYHVLAISIVVRFVIQGMFFGLRLRDA